MSQINSRSPSRNLKRYRLLNRLQSKQPLFIFFLYALLTLILTYPLIVNLRSAVPSDIGDPLLNTWILAWDAHALLTDPLNLFNANIFHPLSNTLAYSEHLLSVALPALPLQLITGEPIVAYNFSLLLSFPLAAFGMYLLALHWTHRRDAAFIAGLVFGFAPYRFAAIAHLQLLTFQWVPFAVLFLDKILEEKTGGRERGLVASGRHYTTFGIFLLLQILASWYLAIYTGLIIGFYLLIHLLSRRFTPPFKSRLVKLVLTFLIIMGITLPVALPYLTLVDELRESRPLSMALSLAAVPTDYVAAAPFNRIFGPFTEQFRNRPGFTEENTLFVGFIAPLLLLAALLSAIPAFGFKKLNREYTKFIAFFVLLTVTVSLTFPTPYAVLARLIPASTIVRVPPRWIIPALFAVSAPAAWGWVTISKKHAPLKYSVLVAGTLLLLAESFSVPIPLAQVDNRSALNPAYHWLAQRSNATQIALIELPLHSAPAPEFPEVKRLYASTAGWWRLVNGYSGYTPARQAELARKLAGFPDEQSIAALQNLSTLAGANSADIDKCRLAINKCQLYLLVHPGEAPFDRTQWETTARRQTEKNPVLRPVGHFEGDYLYQVLPANPDRFSARPLATFGKERNISLLATDFSQLRQPQQLTLFWKAGPTLAHNVTVFIHFRAADGFVRSQADGPPVSGYYPAPNWQPGEIVQDIHPLPAEEDFSQVDHIAIGLYHPTTGKRLPAFGPDGTRLPNDALILRPPLVP